MSADSDPVAPSHPSRRRLLTLLGAGSGALAATLATREPAYAGHDTTNVLHLAEHNAAPAGTTLGTDDAAQATLHLFNTLGESLHCDGPVGIFGDVSDNLVLIGNAGGNGLAAEGFGQYGLEGVIVGTTTPGSAGVVGVSMEDGGEYGAGAGVGVQGSSGTGTGVSGFGQTTAFGVRGHSIDGVGVQATSDFGVALEVWGPAAFSTSGQSTVPTGESAVFVAQPAVTDSSHVSVTFTGNPGARRVSWVERAPGSGFTVHLSSVPGNQRKQVDFTYLVVEPA